MYNLMTIYQQLFDRYGPRHWWPAETPFEVAIGAILTQNTNWNNVEKAIANLRVADALSCEAICALSRNQLETLIRPAGFFARKLNACNCSQPICATGIRVVWKRCCNNRLNRCVKNCSNKKVSGRKLPTRFCSTPENASPLWLMPTPAAYSVVSGCSTVTKNMNSFAAFLWTDYHLKRPCITSTTP